MISQAAGGRSWLIASTSAQAISGAQVLLRRLARATQSSQLQDSAGSSSYSDPIGLRHGRFF